MEWFTQCEEGGYNGLHGDGLLDLQGKTDWCLWSVGQGNRSVPDAQCGSSTQKDVIHFPFLWCWKGEGVGRWYGLVVMLVMGVGRWGGKCTLFIFSWKYYWKIQHKKSYPLSKQICNWSISSSPTHMLLAAQSWIMSGTNELSIQIKSPAVRTFHVAVLYTCVKTNAQLVLVLAHTKWQSYGFQVLFLIWKMKTDLPNKPDNNDADHDGYGDYVSGGWWWQRRWLPG